MKKKALWDGKREIVLTKRFIAAIEELAKAEMAMMGAQKGMSAKDWATCLVEIGDLSRANCISMCYGSVGDFIKRAGVTIKVS